VVSGEASKPSGRHQARPCDRALVPEEKDRKTEGLMLPMSVKEQSHLAVLHKTARPGVGCGGGREIALVAKCRSDSKSEAVVNAGLLQPVGTLSGGNQQKSPIGPRALRPN